LLRVATDVSAWMRATAEVFRSLLRDMDAPSRFARSTNPNHDGRVRPSNKRDFCPEKLFVSQIKALLFQLLLLAYHQATTWCDFFPFNGVRFYSRRERALEASSNLVLMALPPIGFFLHVPALMKFGVIYYFVLFAIECATWWGPYFFGASPKWAEMHVRLHGQTITPLPRREGHPPPNLEHLILMVLTVTAAIATQFAYRAAGGEIFPERKYILIVVGLLAGGAFYQFVLAGRGKSKTPDRPGS
jgi:hypothetical protein